MDPTNKDCPNFDPCLLRDSITADFSIKGQFSILSPWNEIYFEDSLFIGRQLKFEATHQNATNYKWYLGTEIVEGPSDSIVYRNISYPVDLPPGRYYAALVVEYDVDEECFPHSTAKDSVYKDFYKISDRDVLIASKFRGVFENEGEDSVTIEIAMIKDFTGPSSDYELIAINLLGNNDSIYTGSSLKAYVNKAAVWEINSLNLLKGDIEIFEDGSSVVWNYSIQGVEKNFRGIIIN